MSFERGKLSIAEAEQVEFQQGFRAQAETEAELRADEQDYTVEEELSGAISQESMPVDRMRAELESAMEGGQPAEPMTIPEAGLTFEPSDDSRVAALSQHEIDTIEHEAAGAVSELEKELEHTDLEAIPDNHEATEEVFSSWERAREEQQAAAAETQVEPASASAPEASAILLDTTMLGIETPEISAEGFFGFDETFTALYREHRNEMAGHQISGIDAAVLDTAYDRGSDALKALQRMFAAGTFDTNELQEQMATLQQAVTEYKAAQDHIFASALEAEATAGSVSGVSSEVQTEVVSDAATKPYEPEYKKGEWEAYVERQQARTAEREAAAETEAAESVAEEVVEPAKLSVVTAEVADELEGSVEIDVPAAADGVVTAMSSEETEQPAADLREVSDAYWVPQAESETSESRTIKIARTTPPETPEQRVDTKEETSKYDAPPEVGGRNETEVPYQLTPEQRVDTKEEVSKYDLAPELNTSIESEAESSSDTESEEATGEAAVEASYEKIAADLTALEAAMEQAKKDIFSNHQLDYGHYQAALRVRKFKPAVTRLRTLLEKAADTNPPLLAGDRVHKKAIEAAWQDVQKVANEIREKEGEDIWAAEKQSADEVFATHLEDEVSQAAAEGSAKTEAFRPEMLADIKNTKQVFDAKLRVLEEGIGHFESAEDKAEYTQKLKDQRVAFAAAESSLTEFANAAAGELETIQREFSVKLDELNDHIEALFALDAEVFEDEREADAAAEYTQAIEAQQEEGFEPEVPQLGVKKVEKDDPAIAEFSPNPDKARTPEQILRTAFNTLPQGAESAIWKGGLIRSGVKDMTVAKFDDWVSGNPNNRVLKMIEGLQAQMDEYQENWQPDPDMTVEEYVEALAEELSAASEAQVAPQATVTNGRVI